MLFLYLNTSKFLVRNSLHSLNVILSDVPVLNKHWAPSKRRTPNKRRTKISVKLISAAALKRGFTALVF